MAMSNQLLHSSSRFVSIAFLKTTCLNVWRFETLVLSDIQLSRKSIHFDKPCLVFLYKYPLELNIFQPNCTPVASILGLPSHLYHPELALLAKRKCFRPQ